MTPDAVALLVLAMFASSPAFAGNEAHQILVRMPDEKRKETMTQHVRRSNESCDVSRTFFQGFDKQGSAHWSVGCTNGQAYVVRIPNDVKGSTKILDCKVLKTISDVDCFRKF